MSPTDDSRKSSQSDTPSTSSNQSANGRTKPPSTSRLPTAPKTYGPLSRLPSDLTSQLLWALVALLGVAVAAVVL